MGVKFSQLPSLGTSSVASGDQIAILDVSENILKKTPISHASTTNAFGIGTGSAYGHVKIANNLTTSTYADGVVLSAYQGYVISGKITTLTTNVSNLTTSVNGLSTDVTNLKGGQITLAVNPASTANMNIWITT